MVKSLKKKKIVKKKKIKKKKSNAKPTKEKPTSVKSVKSVKVGRFGPAGAVVLKGMIIDSSGQRHSGSSSIAGRLNHSLQGTKKKKKIFKKVASGDSGTAHYNASSLPAMDKTNSNSEASSSSSSSGGSDSEGSCSSGGGSDCSHLKWIPLSFFITTSILLLLVTKA